MFNFKHLTNKLLKVGILLIPFFLIVFFLSPNITRAASFKYADFDFDKFAEENLGYWTYLCSEDYDNQPDIDKCKEKIIASQRVFYTRLYKLLAKYQSRGLFIDDKIIIMTAFFELDPDLFADSGDYYKEVTGSSNNPYTGDESDVDYDIDKEYDASYWENESDSIKLLIKSMLGYRSQCYGTYEPTIIENDDGTKTTECVGSMAILENGVCKDLIKQDYVGFWEKVLANSGVLSFFGIKSEAEDECKNEAASKGYAGYNYNVNTAQEVAESKYWEFLIKGNYFDKKPHLSNYYTKVLDKTGKKRNTELTETEKETYKDDITEARTKIVEMIKDLLNNYGQEDNMVNYTSAGNPNAFWWPIGSSETTEEGGITYANGTPVATTITSMFGLRIDPITGAANSGHTGIDIAPGGSPGVVNVIASKDGIVTKVINNCVSFGDKTCGGGYGNYIMISHSDGMYTLYAHLHEGTINVKVNDSVRQGQVIAKVGSSGRSTGTHLHFEVRTDVSTRVDPLNYVDQNNPRPASSASSSLVELIEMLEGSVGTGDTYTVYCNSGDIPTVGHGITLANNLILFQRYGINLTTSNNYYNYCGTTMNKGVVDQIFADRLNQDRESIKAMSVSNGQTLTDNQLDALASMRYNRGNINGFFDAYSSYGSTDALCTNWWNETAIRAGSQFEKGLRNRRQKECKIFVHGY